MTAPLNTSWEGDLAAVFPNTLGGRVAAVTQFGRTQVSIVIEEGEEEFTYGWRIDSGSCSEQGEIQGGVASYPPLVTSEGGTAQAEAVLSTEFKHGGQFSARVFLSGTGGAGEVVACGEMEQVR